MNRCLFLSVIFYKQWQNFSIVKVFIMKIRWADKVTKGLAKVSKRGDGGLFVFSNVVDAYLNTKYFDRIRIRGSVIMNYGSGSERPIRCQIGI
jgi:hypothetical protein